MRWKLKKKHLHKKQIKKKFLFFPLKISREIRWLERVKILQSQSVHGGWLNMKFIDD